VCTGKFVTLGDQDFSNLPNIRTNLLFHTWFEKLGFHCIITTVYFIRYSRASRKRPSKMQRLSGHLQKSNHRGPLPRRGAGTSTLWKIIYCIQFTPLITPCAGRWPMWLLKFFVYFRKHSAHSVHRDQRMRQVVACKMLKTIENH